MFFKCPVCHRRSIFFLTKLLAFIPYRYDVPNRFRCTACGAPLKCYFAIVPLFFIGWVVFFISGAFSTCYYLGASFGSALTLSGAFVALSLFLYPIYPEAESHVRHGGLRAAGVLAMVVAINVVVGLL